MNLKISRKEWPFVTTNGKKNENLSIKNI